MRELRLYRTQLEEVRSSEQMAEHRRETRARCLRGHDRRAEQVQREAVRSMKRDLLRERFQSVSG